MSSLSCSKLNSNKLASVESTPLVFLKHGRVKIRSSLLLIFTLLSTSIVEIFSLRNIKQCTYFSLDIITISSVTNIRLAVLKSNRAKVEKL